MAGIKQNLEMIAFAKTQLKVQSRGHVKGRAHQQNEQHCKYLAVFEPGVHLLFILDDDHDAGATHLPPEGSRHTGLPESKKHFFRPCGILLNGAGAITEDDEKSGIASSPRIGHALNRHL